MKSTIQPEDYWNTNQDPFNWSVIQDHALERVWRKAVDTYLSPEVADTLARAGDLSGKRVLMPGCGLGQGAVVLARMGAIVTGVDISPRRCELARAMVAGMPEAGRINFLCADAEKMSLKSASFDLIIDQDVLMYSDAGKVISECGRLLVPGGKAVFIESLADHPVARLFRLMRRKAIMERHLSLHQLISLSSASLSKEHVESYYFLSVSAFAALYFFKIVWLYRLLLRLFFPVDRFLFRVFPGFKSFAWKGVVSYRKATESSTTDEHR